MLALPGIKLASAVGCDLAALAPAHDERVEAQRLLDPGLDAFLGRFADTFGNKFEPALLLIAQAAPEAASEPEAIAGFRDAVALAGIMPARARMIEKRQRQVPDPLWADDYDFFPWMVSKDGDRLVGSTPALLSAGNISALRAVRGHSSPLVLRRSTDPSRFDHPLLEALLKRWTVRFDGKEPCWRDRALFRSLNMAFSAARVPSGTEEVFYDYGRVAALWVSAFEILVHPGEDGRAGLGKVVDLLEGAPWVDGDARQKGIRIRINKRDCRCVTCASWLYEKLYRCRCDFLHGNPVEQNDLRIDPCGRMVTEFAAPLYRAALAAFLDVGPTTLSVNDDVPEQANLPNETIDFDKHQNKILHTLYETMDFDKHQELVENALLSACPPPDQHKEKP